MIRRGRQSAPGSSRKIRPHHLTPIAGAQLLAPLGLDVNLRLLVAPGLELRCVKIIGAVAGGGNGAGLRSTPAFDSGGRGQSSHVMNLWLKPSSALFL